MKANSYSMLLFRATKLCMWVRYNYCANSTTTVVVLLDIYGNDMFPAAVGSLLEMVNMPFGPL